MLSVWMTKQGACVGVRLVVLVLMEVSKGVACVIEFDLSCLPSID